MGMQWWGADCSGLPQRTPWRCHSCLGPREWNKMLLLCCVVYPLLGWILAAAAERSRFTYKGCSHRPLLVCSFHDSERRKLDPGIFLRTIWNHFRAYREGVGVRKTPKTPSPTLIRCGAIWVLNWEGQSHASSKNLAPEQRT